MIVLTPTENVRRMDVRRNTTAIVKDGQSYRVIKGGLVTEAEFNEMFPVPGKVEVEKRIVKGKMIGKWGKF